MAVFLFLRILLHTMRITGPPNTNTSMIGKTGIFFLMLSVSVLFGVLGLMFILTPEKIVEPFRVPPLFYANTIFLVTSSVLIHLGWTRRSSHSARPYVFWAWVLGVAFLLGQAYACYGVYRYYAVLQQSNIGGELASALASNAKRDYLYVLSAVHGFHLLGGIAFLVYVWKGYLKFARKYLEIAVYFWHFLGVLWGYLLLVLTFAS